MPSIPLPNLYLTMANHITTAYNQRLYKTSRIFYLTLRKYCDNKSIYERDEEGPKPRVVHGQLYPEWRKPWIRRPGEWYSKFSLFVERNPNPDILNTLQKVPQFNIQVFKDWWKDMKVIQEKVNQQFLSERVSILGSNLAAVHFFTYRKAAVRLKNSTEWIQGDALTMDLPNTFVEGYQVEAIDCTNFIYNGIRYEGLENLMGLSFLKWLSLKNNRHVDVWCLDRVAGQNGRSLEYLDISGCNLCVGGVFALARMSALRCLVISDPGDNYELQAALSVLEEENEKLLIKIV